MYHIYYILYDNVYDIYDNIYDIYDTYMIIYIYHLSKLVSGLPESNHIWGGGVLSMVSGIH